MELKNFITETLCQIINGLKDAQEQIGEPSGDIEERVLAPFINPSPASEYDKKLYEIDFDVAVTAMDTGQSLGGGGISVMGINLTAKVNSEQVNSSVTHIKFKVPVSYPYHVKKHGK